MKRSASLSSRRALVEGLESRQLLAGTFVEQNGLLMVEVESESTNGWTRVTSPGGYTGSAAYQWNGPDHFKNGGTAILKYDFKINNAGNYNFKLRSYNVTNDAKEFNDIWVRIDGGKWEKVFQSRNKQWTWFTRREVSHGVYDNEWTVNLGAGNHKIEISARSNKFIIDRFALHKSGVAFESTSIPQSSTTSGGGTANPPPTTPPPASGSGSIAGYLFNDSNADGVQNGNEGRTGSRTVFLDANRNGKLDSGERSTTSDAQGNYKFSNLPIGTYYATRVFPSGFKLSNNSVGYVTVNVASGQNVTGINLGTTDGKPTTPTNPPPASGTGKISGFLWNDTNANGKLDGSEGRTGSRTVFLDANRNGKLDAGEISTTSDAQGNYSFNGLSYGAYYVSRVFPSGYKLSNNNAGHVSVTLSASTPNIAVNLGTRNA